MSETTNNAEDIAKLLIAENTMLHNALSNRARQLGLGDDPRRDIDDECGQPKIDQSIDVKSFHYMYRRDGLANGVVSVLPKETWQKSPSIIEDEDPDKETPFEEAWKELSEQLTIEPSYVRRKKTDLVWSYLQRLDVMSGIGRYGVMLIGLNDGKTLDQPVIPSNSMELTYLRVLPEALAPITEFEADTKNPRYGQPTYYNLTINDPDEQVDGVGHDSALQRVHYSRVIHVADNKMSSEIFGLPRQEPVYNYLLGLRKVTCGSAEMYWKGAFPGYSFETMPQLGGDVNIDKDNLKEMAENYMNGLQRYMTLMGMTVNSLAPQVVDPSPQIRNLIEQISITLGIPMRILMGSERGSLASDQDDSTWTDRLVFRQVNHINPSIIVPFTDRLITYGVLPQPTEGYGITWPEINTRDDTEKAAIATSIVTAMATYITSGAESVMAPMDFLTKVLWYTDEEAESIVEKASEEAGDQDSVTDQQLQDLLRGSGNNGGFNQPTGAGRF